MHLLQLALLLILTLVTAATVDAQATKTSLRALADGADTASDSMGPGAALAIAGCVAAVVGIALIAKAMRQRLTAPSSPQTPPPLAMHSDECLRVSATTPIQ
ncbi:hypothetical protein SPRG_13395 [Saprolegnia parasitica CBS 223.65]|uniref:RxLR effector protein n=1 Tax=Saprolegnia parasitica (strain CBS 223.65) TaxID=695850 RepID=A0A067C1H4_SAPPC|nr:hypothetical protein SPRG_13395 [Saprolegnia parasitica CBS 223.65]KDO20642.1 hypothetical protein SPRG_13395 [Saprolegnia parasitica CBS 223.65]|eukprot:XP_012208608.1 hypothetical protein SPRG_13395 [Saprolegnia parasitica CBS 223.65]